ncbi:MAG: 30S ribosomal protein S6--L-glutamate ligase, partial [Candidatus Thermoplasmatota archaeon]|nr:30S ribosomal protein S6--L-glutamate ligase [Candidatus Thermoplasmatota archaeon]
ARGREFRSNFHLNGTVEPVDLDPAFEEVACRAARVLGLRVAGVDLLESEDGPLVLEVNSSPGLEGIEKASGVNVAGEIIDFVINDAVFTEVELDKLLRTVPGEGVLSIQLLHHPNLIGHSIDEIFANSEQPPVYALSRGVKMMWNPEPSVQLRYDDVLICYGELESLRATLRKAVLMSPPITTDSPSSEETNA